MSVAQNAQQMMPVAQAAQLPGPTGAAGQSGSGGGVGVGDLLRVVKQRLLMIIILFILFYSTAIGVTAVVWKFAPAYWSEAYLEFVPPTEGPFDLSRQVLPMDYVDQQLNTIAAGIQSSEVLLDLLAQEEIKGTEFYRWYGDTPAGQADCLEDLKDMLSVSPVRKSYLIRVGLATKRAPESKLIVNTLVQRYRDRSREMDTDQRLQRLNQLKDRRTEAVTNLTDVQKKIADLRADRDMPAMEAHREILNSAISLLTNTQAELLAREADVNAQLDSFGGTDPRNLPITAEMQLIIESDPELRVYRQQVEQFDIQIDVLRETTISNNHPQMKMLQAQRDRWFQREASRRDELLDNLRRRQVESLRQNLARIRTTLEEVQDQLNQRQAELTDLDSAITTLQELEYDRERYNAVLQEVEASVAAAESVHAVQAREGKLMIYAAAKESIWPSRPQPIVYLGGGLVLSLLASVGIAFLLELTDKAVRTPLDVARYGSMSVLGSVPELDDEEVDIDDIEYATRQAPQSMVAEAYRQIRAHLTFSGPLDSQRTLLITSPRPEDGKSSVAINLGVTFAQGGQRVLLVDCNFRRPTIRGVFEGTQPDGLSNVLVGQRTLREAATSCEVGNLDIVASGPMPPNPAELLGSPQMQALLEEARTTYDRVIIDGPPALLMSDALVLAIQVDAVIIVARAGSSAKGALRRVREQLQRINARVIGGVLNGAKARPGGYYRQQYREFYEYADENVVPQELGGAPPELETSARDHETGEDDERG